MDARRRSLVGILGSLPVVLAGCAGMAGREPVSVGVADIRLGKAGVFEQQYFVTLRIQNPNDRELALKGVVFQLDLNDKSFAKGTSPSDAKVPPYGSTLVEVETLSGLGGILRQVGAVAGEGGTAPTSFKYRIKGRLHTTGMSGAVPFDDSGELKLGSLGEGASK